MQRFLFLIALFCLIASPAFARQLQFQTAAIGNMVQFQYQYAGFDGAPVNLAFQINKRQLDAAIGQFQSYNPSAMDAYVIDGLRDYAARFPNVQINIDRVGDAIGYNVSGSNQMDLQKVLDDLQQRTKIIQDQYLESQYYIKDTTGKFIMPDHTRIAADYITPMRPVARAILVETRDRSATGLINAALNFLQAIPYDTLQDRQTSNGSGFATPYGLLALNRGDCDTKSVALIAMVKSLFPNLPAVIVYTRNHAFVGFQIPASRGDRILTIEKRVFVLTEPAGPGYLPAGRIGHESSSDLDKNYFSYVMML